MARLTEWIHTTIYHCPDCGKVRTFPRRRVGKKPQKSSERAITIEQPCNNQFCLHRQQEQKGDA